MEDNRFSGVFLGSLMKLARVVVAPIAFSQAITASGVETVRPSIPLAMTEAMNLRIFGPTAQVTYQYNVSDRRAVGRIAGLTISAFEISLTTSASLCLELMAR